MNNTEKITKCRKILNKTSPGDRITDPEDIDFLIQIFEGHSEWILKKGLGIDYLTTGMSIYKNRCFIIHRIDGSSTDISFTHSIKNRTPIAEIKNACRNAIKNTILKFKNENIKLGVTRCPITNEILTQENIHIDHYDLTFNELFNKWIEDKDIEFLFNRLNKTMDNNNETYFIDANVAFDFIKFHNENTHLRGVSKKANLSILK